MAKNLTFNALKRKVLEHFGEQTTKFILAQYSDIKQKSDSIDMNFWASWLIHYSVDGLKRSDIEKAIYENVAAVMDGDKTFEQALEDISPLDDDHKHSSMGTEIYERFAWEQIAKTAMRQAWVMQIKNIFWAQYFQMENATTKEELRYNIVMPGDNVPEERKANCMYPYIPEL